MRKHRLRKKPNRIFKTAQMKTLINTLTTVVEINIIMIIEKKVLIKIKAVPKMVVSIMDIIMKDIKVMFMEKEKVTQIQNNISKTITAILRKVMEEIQTKTKAETQTKKDSIVDATRTAIIIMKNTRKNKMAIAKKIIKRTEDSIQNKKDHRTSTRIEVNTRTRKETGKKVGKR